MGSPETIARICVDILIVAIIGLSAVLGWRKGLAAVIFSCFRWLICIVVCFVAAAPFQDFLTDKTGLDDSIYNHVKSTLSTTLSGNYFFAAMPEQIQGTATTYQQNMAEQVAISVSDVLTRIVSFLILFLIVIIITGIIEWLLERKDDDSPIGYVNGFLGLCFGILRGVLIVSILMLGVFALIGFANPAAVTPIVSGIRSSYLAGLFYDSNPLIMLFEMF